MEKSPTSNSTTRRKAIKNLGLLAPSFMIVPRHILGKGYVAPSDKLNIAAIGAGGKGRVDISGAYANGANNIIALCDIDAERSMQTRTAFPKANFYDDFRKMLDELKDDIDAVTISTPDHTHAVAAMAAMSLGKHVYVQKPLANTIHETRMLTETARKNRIVSQMGNHGASNPTQQLMVKWYDEGLLGRVHTVHVWTDRPVWPQGIQVPKPVALPKFISKEQWDLFIGPAEMVGYHPLYHPFKWRGWWNFGTGALGDMGCHLIDTPFRVLRLGYPTEVECSVGQVFTKDWTPEHIPEGCPPSSRIELKFEATKENPTDIKMTWHDGGVRPFHPDLIPASDFIGGADSANGVIMIGEKGIMTCGMLGHTPQLYLNSGEKLEVSDTYGSENSYAKLNDYGHQLLWTEACKAGFGSSEHLGLTSSFDYAGPLTETVLMGNLAIRSYMHASPDAKDLHFEGRKRLLWNGKDMQITNYAPAAQFVKRTYRKGWTL